MEAIDVFLSVPQEGALQALRELEGDFLVLGAGGKMGLHLCLMLRQACDTLGKSNTVWAASRFQGLNSADPYESNGVKTLAGDFRDDAFVETLPLCPTVFYLVGAKFGTTGNPDLLREINVEVSARIASRFRASKIIAFSTGCVYSYASPGSGGSNEESLTDPIGEYAQSCLEREKRFEAISVEHGTQVSLIRLNYSVEFRYGVLVDIGQKVMDDEPIDVTMGYFNLIWQNDALNQIVQTLDYAGSPARPINITGADIVSIRSIAQRFGKLFGKAPRFTGEEEATMWVSNASRSHKLYGKPSVELGTMIEWTAAWLAQEGRTYGKPTGFEKRDGKF